MVQGVFESDVDNTSAVTATGKNGANAIIANSDRGRAIRVHSDTNTGVESTGQIGVRGISYSPGGVGISGEGATGVHGTGDSTTGTGISGLGNTGVSGRSYSTNGVGVIGFGSIGVDGRARTSDGTGVRGHSSDGPGVSGNSTSGPGVSGNSTSGTGVSGSTNSGTGVSGSTNSGTGVSGTSNSGAGVIGHGHSGSGAVIGHNYGFGGVGVVGISDSYGVGVSGFGQTGVKGEGFFGVEGHSVGGAGFGIFGNASDSSADGVWGFSRDGFGGYFYSKTSWAGWFEGPVKIIGDLTTSDGRFKIDHPLDPENKYLSHSIVQSPDMVNIYNGITVTDTNGDATIILPDYFEALNQDFRYQLTVIGQFAQAIVAAEIRNNRFTIKTDQPNIRVSWQVIGVRKDPFANARRIVVEEDKAADERGLYLHPEAHGKPETQSIRSLHEKRLRRP
jgi:hypothetical protein